nr:MAG TPA: transcriptional regulator, y4mF family [Caudoviricetes sp.]
MNLHYICRKEAIFCTMNYSIIKERRTLLGLTQQDLADYTGLGLRTIKDVETGKGNPSVATLLKIAEVLGLELQLKVKEVVK